MIVLQGLYSALLMTQGFTGEASGVTASRGCVHSMDVARYRADVSDAPVTLLSASDSAPFSCTVSDEAC